ncbi:MAG: hypothetical protein WC966_10890 [Bradymonadales bacterium]
MRLSYEDMLSGAPIYIEEVGHIRSPQLKELNPTTGIGIQKYNSYLNMLSQDKEDLTSALEGVAKKQAAILRQAERLNTFDVISLQPMFIPVVQNALEFFMTETVRWKDKERVFVACGKNKSSAKKTGYINRDNYDGVRNEILRMNYIGVDRDEAPAQHGTDRAKERWEKAQAFLKSESKKQKGNENYRLGNIISKLSAASTGYTLLNIYELTVFQLYDQFVQYGYLRGMGLNELSVVTHGKAKGSRFSFEDWLKPIAKL